LIVDPFAIDGTEQHEIGNCKQLTEASRAKELKEATAPDPRTTRYDHLLELTLQLPYTNGIQNLELCSITASLANWNTLYEHYAGSLV